MKYLLAAAVAAFIPVAAQAADYTEVGDAGQTKATAQSTVTGPGGVSIGGIGGTLDNEQDADLYYIYIANPSIFSAIVSSPGEAIDSALFLFDVNGNGIATNDDTDGTNFQATLPAGNALYASRTAGFYYLGISNSRNEPVNSASQLLFAMGQYGVRGPASGVTPTTLSDFDSFAYQDAGTGAYRIALTGVTSGPAVVRGVPEPSSWALLVGGFGLVGGAMRRRRAPRPLAA